VYSMPSSLISFPMNSGPDGLNSCLIPSRSKISISDFSFSLGNDCKDSIGSSFGLPVRSVVNVGIVEIRSIEKVELLSVGGGKRNGTTILISLNFLKRVHFILLFNQVKNSQMNRFHHSINQRTDR
ncbi:hypothetical protein PMAYCL1PPCAC_14268, partial [Pristionchus mayeri]